MSLPEAAYGGPVYDLAEPDPVLAWVTFPDRSLEVEARVIAYTERAALVEWGVLAGGRVRLGVARCPSPTTLNRVTLTMMRRNQQDGREERRARRAAEQALDDQDHGEYVPPARSECSPKDWYESIDDADTLRIEYRLWRKDGRLVDFAIILLGVDMDGEWVEVARMDCCHGYAHLHHVEGKTSAVKPLHTADDVPEAFEIASIRIVHYAATIRDVRNSDD